MGTTSRGGNGPILMLGPHWSGGGNVRIGMIYLTNFFVTLSVPLKSVPPTAGVFHRAGKRQNPGDKFPVCRLCTSTSVCHQSAYLCLNTEPVWRSTDSWHVFQTLTLSPLHGIMGILRVRCNTSVTYKHMKNLELCCVEALIWIQVFITLADIRCSFKLWC